jgi:hypothetical protein
MNMVLCGPEGERVPSQACFLEVVPGRRLQFSEGFDGMKRFMEDPRLPKGDMPFDGKRMIFGGFKPIVEL